MVRSPLMPLIVAGPTAIGKSALAMDLAKRFNGEIICADSRQFYAHMSIGTAGPKKDELLQIPHHGYGILDPKTTKIDAGFFISFAKSAIAEVHSRKKRPILVGGTGFYLRALHYGLQDVPVSNQVIAKDLAKRCEELGNYALYQELKSVDEDSAKTIQPNDAYRIMRALEIFYSTGQKPSKLRESFLNGPPALLAHWLYKKPEKAVLIKNLEARVKAMFDEGLVEEAKELRNYLPKDHWALDVMGYREALLLVDNKLSLSQAIELTFIRHRQYAKRQYTWFNKESFYRLVVR